LDRWALTNPHLSLHIPSDSRITVATKRKAKGRPRRPAKSLVSIISNLHLLLRVPSFARWPLGLHFFSPEVHAAWVKWCATANDRLRDTIAVTTDFRKPATKPQENDDVSSDSAVEDEQDDSGREGTDEPGQKVGIYALPLDYEPLKGYAEKGKNVFEFEREGRCVVCHDAMESGEGIHAICSNDGCEGVAHLSCWSKHFLADPSHEAGGILPIKGRCPKCWGEIRWGDMMKELTLRLRGQKEVEKLLKVKRKRAVKTKPKP